MLCIPFLKLAGRGATSKFKSNTSCRSSTALKTSSVSFVQPFAAVGISRRDIGAGFVLRAGADDAGEVAFPKTERRREGAMCYRSASCMQISSRSFIRSAGCKEGGAVGALCGSEACPPAVRAARWRGASAVQTATSSTAPETAASSPAPTAKGADGVRVIYMR